jgi:hypothetical protein
MVYQGLQSAVMAVPTDVAVAGARSTRLFRASPKCFQNRAGVGGRGSGGPKSRLPAQWVSACLEIFPGTAVHIAWHAVGAKC